MVRSHHGPPSTTIRGCPSKSRTSGKSKKTTENTGFFAFLSVRVCRLSSVQPDVLRVTLRVRKWPRFRLLTKPYSQADRHQIARAETAGNRVLRRRLQGPCHRGPAHRLAPAVPPLLIEYLDQGLLGGGLSSCGSVAVPAVASRGCRIRERLRRAGIRASGVVGGSVGPDAGRLCKSTKRSKWSRPHWESLNFVSCRQLFPDQHRCGKVRSSDPPAAARGRRRLEGELF